MTTTTTLSISDLRTTIAGRVVTADDPDYDEVRRVSLGSIDDRPAVWLVTIERLVEDEVGKRRE